MLKKIWNVIFIELVIVMMLAGRSITAEAKEIVSDHGLRIEVIRDHGDTVLKFSDGRARRYDFSGKVRVVNEKKLTARMLKNRRNKVIYIERVVGYVTNNRLDGRTTAGGYISYRSNKSLRGKIRKGDKIISYFIYNPYTTWLDDVDERYDVPQK